MTTILRQSPGAPEAPESDARRPSGRAGHGLAMVIIAAALPTLMTALDDLVMTFALPVIQKAMNASVTQLQWFVNAYTIVFAALLLPAAALGDRFGRRRVFLIGITVFTGASAWAAVSGSSAMLIAARAVEGAGAAAIVTLSLALLADMVPPAKRPMAIGIWGGVNGIGTAAGPIVGGAVIQGLHWSAIFWINVPVGVVAIVLALVSLRGAAAARGS
ncbi:MFS transporter, partial [Propionibacterium freudenreichii]